LLFALLGTPSCGANGAPVVGVAPLVLKLRQGAALEQVKLPEGVATVPVDTLYPNVVTPVTLE
jgi:hypothetical protein